MPKTLRVEGGGKRHPLNMRTTRETRDRLEAAVAASGRSLVQEVEARLEQSFQIERALGDPRLARLMFGMAANFALAVEDEDWAADPVVYARGAAAAIREMLRRFPGGQGDPDRRNALLTMSMQLMTVLVQEQQK